MPTGRRTTGRNRSARRVVTDVEAFSRHALERPLRAYQLEAARAIAASVVERRGLTFTPK